MMKDTAKIAREDHDPAREVLTLRDYFASAALEGILASPRVFNAETQAGAVADLCYRFANAMIAERERRGAS